MEEFSPSLQTVEPLRNSYATSSEGGKMDVTRFSHNTQVLYYHIPQNLIEILASNLTWVYAEEITKATYSLPQRPREYFTSSHKLLTFKEEFEGITLRRALAIAFAIIAVPYLISYVMWLNGFIVSSIAALAGGILLSLMTLLSIFR